MASRIREFPVAREFPELREIPVTREFPRLKLFPPVSRETGISREILSRGFPLNITAIVLKQRIQMAQARGIVVPQDILDLQKVQV